MRFNHFLEANLYDTVSGFLNSKMKADVFLNQFLRSKKIGKRDRLWISDRFYFYLRHRLFFDEISSDNLLPKNIAMMFDEEPDEILLEKIDRLKSSNDFENLYSRSFSPFLAKKISEHFTDPVWDWFNTKSKVTIRANVQKIQRDSLVDILISEGYEVEITPISPNGILILSSSSNLKNSELFKKGLFEFQDESSQIASLLVCSSAKTVLDPCAGGGGKSLAIKSFFPEMSVTASDNRVHLFKEIAQRSQRAETEVHTKEIHLIKNSLFDTVFIDAPCSGSGVLRRNPGDRYSITEESVKENRELQSRLLRRFSENVRPLGELIYVTCSFLKDENEQIVEKFLNEFKNFELISAKERLNENLIDGSVTEKMIKQDYFRTAPFYERDLMFGAILRKIR